MQRHCLSIGQRVKQDCQVFMTLTSTKICPMVKTAHCRSFKWKAPSILVNALCGSKHQDSPQSLNELSARVSGDAVQKIVRDIDHLYPVSDKITEQIRECTDVDELYMILLSNEKQLNNKHVSRAIWTFYGIGKSWVLTDSDSIESINPYVRAEIGKKVSNHPDYQFLLSLLSKHLSSIGPSALSRVLLAISWLILPVPNRLTEKILFSLLGSLKELTTEELAILSTSVRYNRHLMRLKVEAWPLAPILNHAAKLVTTCDHVQDLRNLATVFYRCSPLLSDEVAVDFEERLKHFLSTGEVNKLEHGCLLRILCFLTCRLHASSRDIAVKVVELLEPNIDKLHRYELLSLNTVLNGLLEPESVMRKVANRCYRLLEASRYGHPMTRLNLLTSVGYIPVESKAEVENLLLTVLNTPDVEYRLKDVIQVAKSTGTMRRDIMDLYWMRIMESCCTLPHEEERFFTLSLGCSWYADYHLGNSQLERCREFESFAREMYGGRSVYAIAYLIKAVPLLLGTSVDEVPEYIMDNVDNLLLSGKGTLSLKKGLDHCISLHGSRIPHRLNQQLTQLKKKLDSKVVTSIPESRTMLDAARNLRNLLRRGKTDRVLLELCGSRLEEVPRNLNSVLVCDVVYTLSQYRWLSESMLNSCVEYVLQNQNRVAAITAAKLVLSLYDLGYMPSKATELADVTAKKLLSEADRLTSPFILRSALGLDFLQFLPVPLVHHIFNVPFLDRLDAEIKQTTQSKLQHNIRVGLMQLNRAVCLSSPEAKIPWFHEKYCQALFHTESSVAKRDLQKNSSPMHRGIYVSLVNILGGEGLVKRHTFSSYHHAIDFQFSLSPRGNPVAISGDRLKVQGKNEKIAVMVYGSQHYPFNSSTPIGRCQVEIRQLELLGYRVIVIPHLKWDSMELSLPKSRKDFLLSLIWPNR